jgi:hypothetical protein
VKARGNGSKDRSANGTSASVGGVGRIMRSDSRGRTTSSRQLAPVTPGHTWR